MIKKIIFLFLLGFTVTTVRAEEIDRVVAKVNDQIITSKDLKDYCNMVRFQSAHDKSLNIDPNSSDFEKNALDKLIEEKLILMAARKEQASREEMAKKDEKKAASIRLEPPQSYVERETKAAMAEFSDRAAFEKSLAQNGLNNDIFRDHLKEQWLMRTIVEIDVSAYVNVAPQEVLNFYRKHKAQFHTSTGYKLWMGRFIDDKDWQGFKTELLAKGIDAAQKDYSHIVKAVDADAESLRKEFADPLKTAEPGHHFTIMIDKDRYFIYLIKRIEPQPLEYKNIEARISSFIWYKKFRRRFKEWTQGLRAESVIRTNL